MKVPLTQTLQNTAFHAAPSRTALWWMTPIYWPDLPTFTYPPPSHLTQTWNESRSLFSLWPLSLSVIYGSFLLISFDWCYVNMQVGPSAVSCHCQTVSDCTAVSYLFTYLLPGRVPGYPISYPVVYPDNELPGIGSHSRNSELGATKCQVLRVKCIKFDFCFRSRPRWGSLLSRPPNYTVYLRGYF